MAFDAPCDRKKEEGQNSPLEDNPLHWELLEQERKPPKLKKDVLTITKPLNKSLNEKLDGEIPPQLADTGDPEKFSDRHPGPLPDISKLSKRDQPGVHKDAQGETDKITYPDGRSRVFTRTNGQISDVTTYNHGERVEVLRLDSKTGKYEKWELNAQKQWTKPGQVEIKLYADNSFWNTSLGKYVDMPDSSKIARNDIGNATSIIYPDGHKVDYEYFDDNKSLKKVSTKSSTSWRESKDNNDWYRQVANIKTGPREKDIRMEGDLYSAELLDSKHKTKTWVLTDGSSFTQIGTDKIIEHDGDENPVRIYIPGNDWTLTNTKKNEWTDSNGEKANLALQDLEYSYIKNGEVHRFNEEGNEIITKASDTKNVVEYKGGAKWFQDAAKNTVSEFPQGVINLLAANNMKIVISDKLTDVFTDLKGVQPRGWPNGKTWDNVDGVFRGDRKTVVAAARYKSDDLWKTSTRPAGLIRHESGHAVDLCLGNGVNSNYSDSAEFIKAYGADVKLMTANDRSNLEYFLQTNGAGRSETFAETFAYIQGGGSNYTNDDLIEKKFPEIVKLLKKKIADLK